ncbi:hypothetical protein DNTS_024642 [Danionella cerebrum]|uniref:Uncharacterized protein n=1 Tax=Danionella cerebrum TaxID=2873325 RepID=A0A553NHP8_9TELE|nr:hypothetical protein DNTS_024642 [Danionella translucida]
MMNFKERTCEILLGDGTSIRATAQGSYEIYPHGGGVLHIDESGGAIYTSHQSQPEKDLSNQYVMNCKTVLCHVTDSEGNHFQINADGQVTVTGNASEKRPPDYPQTAGFKTHPPRLFVVHKDGSASELLRAEDVEDLLQEAYGDPSIAVLSEPLSGSGASSAITLLRPCTDFQSKWLISKQDDDIIPSNLKSRKWESFPASEKKTSGPAFGTSLGSSPEKRKPVISISASTKQIIECPNVLLVRQITQHAPTTEKLRRKLLDKVKAYVEQLLQRERQWEMMKLKDPQTADEGTHHKRLLQLVLVREHWIYK